MKAKAVRFSPNAARAEDAVYAAKSDLKKALQRAYPLGDTVRVIHSRGEYTGVVVGHDEYGARVNIKNDQSGKISRRWFREVEIA